MGVHDNIFHVIIVKKTIPDCSRELKAIMEHKQKVWCLLFHVFTDTPIEVSEGWEVRLDPWLVDRLNSKHSWVIAPPIDKHVNSFDSPVDRLLVNGLVLFAIPCAHPLANHRGVLEVTFIDPSDLVGHSRVVISILRAFHTVHIKQNLQAVFFSCV